MKITLSLDDDLVESYQKEAGSRRVPVNTVIAQRLQAALPLDPRRRGFVVADAQVLQELEGILGGGSLTSERDLVGKVRRLAAIHFGEHRFEITPGQFEELKFRATKTGRTVEQLVADLYQRMSQDLFRTVA
ncbi:MAG: hypothetical protein DMF56_26910 [Acidobacteria bacterium]|nr:MAG: hypothetical protein DMF56_26910 [Acidobacteriota bacterium]